MQETPSRYKYRKNYVKYKFDHAVVGTLLGQRIN